MLSYEELRQKNEQLREELATLRHKQCPQNDWYNGIEVPDEATHTDTSQKTAQPLGTYAPKQCPTSTLTAAQISRYSRQLLLPAFGVKGQSALLSSSVLVVGSGGLGSSALLYLAASGVGHLGIVDCDQVDRSNLHRQIIYRECEAGKRKVACAQDTLRALNSDIDIRIYDMELSYENALALVEGYDVVVDATDNACTRYLLSDACVLANPEVRPLVSGAALGLEGQATVCNYQNGPCYRCIYPRPLPGRVSSCALYSLQAEAQRSCSDNGVLGLVPGLIGCLQAMEAIKIISRMGDVLTQRVLLYDALTSQFRSIKVPGRSSTCAICGSHPSIGNMQEAKAWATQHGLRGPGEQATCAPAGVPDIPAEHQVTCKEYAKLSGDREGRGKHVLLDVREPIQFAIVSIEGATNLPLSRLQEELAAVPSDKSGQQACDRQSVPATASAMLISRRHRACVYFKLLRVLLAYEHLTLSFCTLSSHTVYCICRRGIASSHATRFLLDQGRQHVYNVQGGLQEWQRTVDPDFAIY